MLTLATTKLDIRFHDADGDTTPLLHGDTDTGVLAHANIPYAIPLGAYVISGMLYIREPIENTYTDGVIIGLAIPTSYHLDKNGGEACADSVIVKVCLNLDASGRKLQGRVCNRKWNGSWSCPGWTTLVSW